MLDVASEDTVMRRVRMISTLAVLVASSSVRASPGHEVRVRGTTSECPSSGSLSTSLSQVLPDRRVTVATDDMSSDVTVTDEGDAFRIAVDGQVRTITDPSRDCAERAVTAAVFAAFVVEPPAGPAIEMHRIRSTLAPTVHGDVALGGLVAGTTKTSLTTGASLRVFIGGDSLGVIAGVSGLSPTMLDVGRAQARLTRWPIDLGARGRMRRGSFAFDADLGAVMTPIFITGMQVGEPASVVELELGGRLAATVELRRWHGWAPFVSLEAVVASRHELVAQSGPDMSSRTTPLTWLSATIGVDMSLF